MIENLDYTRLENQIINRSTNEVANLIKEREDLVEGVDYYLNLAVHDSEFKKIEANRFIWSSTVFVEIDYIEDENIGDMGLSYEVEFTILDDRGNFKIENCEMNIDFENI